MIDQKPAYDKMLNEGVELQLDEKVIAGQVKHQALGPEAKIVGSYYAKPMLNYMIYEVEFSVIQVKEYAVNIIADNMLSEVDDE